MPYGHTHLLQFKDKLKTWRGKLSLKEAAAVLEMDYSTYRKYECGKRTPCKLALRKLEDLMSEISTDAIIKQRHFAARGNQIIGFLTTEDKEE